MKLLISGSMSILIVYYSRSSNTEKVAKLLQKELDCDIEKIDDNNQFEGMIGYVKGIYYSITKKGSPIGQLTKNISDYDLVIVGTPVWAGNMASPIITFLNNNKDQIKEFASFCTCGGSGYKLTIKNMENLSNKTSKASFYLTKYDLSNPNEIIDEFVKKL